MISMYNDVYDLIDVCEAYRREREEAEQIRDEAFRILQEAKAFKAQKEANQLSDNK